jgi:Ricin-type beta-trefoil lectin domain
MWLVIAVALTTLLAFTPMASAQPAGTISSDGAPVYANGTAMSSFQLSSQNVGDVFIGFIEIDASPNPTTTKISSLSGGNADWSNVAQFFGSNGKDYELWKGVTTAVGADTVTISFAGSVAGANVETGFQEFTAADYGPATIWTVDQHGTDDNSTAGTTIPYPSLTATGSGELYWGYGQTDSNGSAGSTTGFSYDVTPQQNVVAWDTSASGTLAPTAVTTSAATRSIAALLTASLAPPLTTGTGYENLSPSQFAPLVMDARSDSHVNPTSNGDPVQVWDNLGGTNQHFTVVSEGSGTYEIHSPSGKCLDAVSDAHHNPGMNGDKLQLWACSGASNQLWRPYAVSGAGSDAMASVASGKVIDDPDGRGNGTRLQLWSYNGFPQQHWAFSATG